MGRPTKYRRDFARQANLLCELGACDHDLARFFAVSKTTITDWKRRHPEFLASIKRGKDFADKEVIRALWKRATGCLITRGIRRVEMARDSGKVVKVVEEAVQIELPPDTAAAFIWLKNRRPDSWRQKIDHENEFTGEIRVTLGGDAEGEK